MKGIFDEDKAMRPKGHEDGEGHEDGSLEAPYARDDPLRPDNLVLLAFGVFDDRESSISR